MKNEERREVRMLRLLRDGVGDSSREILSARRLPSTFFTFFFSKEARDDSRVSLSKVEDALSLFSEWNGDGPLLGCL